MYNNDVVALILAGGEGRRLGGLTKYDAKPLVPFGGKYRIVDFTLSNCANSGLNTVGILTQYLSLGLNSYIRKGSAWGFNTTIGGVYNLPPYASQHAAEWYKGTANSVYQNIEFVERNNAKYVVVLSGDHIYKMDYRPMIEYHKARGAAATIAVIPVPVLEASRFGIMETDISGKIVEFEEKPKNPKSNLASMGVYVFSWDVLKKHLIKDYNNKSSNNDFGKNIVPQMLAANEKMYAYEFNGYWKDVGTIDSLWQSNMDLLVENPELDLLDEKWRISSYSTQKMPLFIGDNATIKRSYLAEGSKIYGNISNSIIFGDTVIEPGCSITNSVIMEGAVIGKNAQIDKSIIAEGAYVGANSRIGIAGDKTPQYESILCSNGITVVSPKISIQDGNIVGRNCLVDSDINKFAINVLQMSEKFEKIGAGV